MRIAQVAPLWERVPPPGYGGIELVVAHLTDELVRRGHEVTLFASGDSETRAKLVSAVPRAIRLDPSVKEPGIYEYLQLASVGDLADQFDLIHFHTGLSALPIAHLLKTPAMHTLHGRFSADNAKVFDRYRSQSYISISLSQREGGPELNYASNVYNGIDAGAYPFCAQPQGEPYLAFLGRLSPEKGPHHAIELARKTGWKLKMAGKVDVVDRAFFEEAIAPQLDGDQIVYLGELDHDQKAALLGGAVATLFPITWREPFGLVMIESMATGTPVIAMNLGAVPEVIVHGQTGFVCDSLTEMEAAIAQVHSLQRQACRDHVLAHFSVACMVDGYEAAYGQVLGEAAVSAPARRSPRRVA